MMTRRDYVEVASAILQERIETADATGAARPDLDRITERLGDVFARSNPLFDRDRFNDAAGYRVGIYDNGKATR
jgi:hypothetical protein